MSVCPQGAAPNGRSWHPAISGDGRYVAFVSGATNLVRGDRNRSADVFLYDTSPGSTVLVSRGAKGGAANGASGLPAISADGKMVAFQSDASISCAPSRCPAAVEDINLLPDVFLFDRATAAVTRISDDRTGGWMAPSVGPALDASGRVVAFTSRHPTDASDNRNDFDLFVRVQMKGSTRFRGVPQGSAGFGSTGFRRVRFQGFHGVRFHGVPGVRFHGVPRFGSRGSEVPQNLEP